MKILMINSPGSSGSLISRVTSSSVRLIMISSVITSTSMDCSNTLTTISKNFIKRCAGDDPVGLESHRRGHGGREVMNIIRFMEVY
jgi:hypothetical protein